MRAPLLQRNSSYNSNTPEWKNKMVLKLVFSSAFIVAVLSVSLYAMNNAFTKAPPPLISPLPPPPPAFTESICVPSLWDTTLTIPTLLSTGSCVAYDLTNATTDFWAASDSACVEYCKCAAVYKDLLTTTVVAALDPLSNVCSCASSLTTCALSNSGTLRIFNPTFSILSPARQYRIYSDELLQQNIIYAPFKIYAPSAHAISIRGINMTSYLYLGSGGGLYTMNPFHTVTQYVGTNVNGYSFVGSAAGEFYLINEDTGNVYFTFPVNNETPGQTGILFQSYYLEIQEGGNFVLGNNLVPGGSIMYSYL